MPMHLPTVRRGLIPQHITYDPYMGGMEQYGALALRPNPGHYGGVRWAYVKYKRTQCKGYDDAVKEYNKAEEAHKKKGCVKATFFGARRSKCKKTAGRMKAAEEKGKNAWKECKAYEKGATKGHVQIDTTGGGFSNVETVTPPVMGVGDMGIMGGAPGMATSGGVEEEESSNTGLYLAVGALLLATGGVVIYKRSQKKKGGRKR